MAEPTDLWITQAPWHEIAQLTQDSLESRRAALRINTPAHVQPVLLKLLLHEYRHSAPVTLNILSTV